MGGSKSKPKDVGQRTRSLDGNLSSGGGAGGHYLNSNQQSLTPNRSPTVDGGLGGNSSMANNAELALFGGVDNNSVTSPNRITLTGGDPPRLEDSAAWVCTTAGFNHAFSPDSRRDHLCGAV